MVQSIVADTHPSQAQVHMACGDSVVLGRIKARAAHGLQLKPGMAGWAQVKTAALVE